MAIADKNFGGFETGDATRAVSVSGTVSVQGTTTRTGSYALRSNPSSSTGYHEYQGIAADGSGAELGITTTEHFLTVYLRIATLPGATAIILRGLTSGGTEAWRVDITSGGVVTATGSTTSGTAATLSVDGLWHRFDLRFTKNATSGLAVDGGSEQTFTCANQTIDRVRFGVQTSTTADIYYDDWVIGTTSPGGAIQVNRLLPNANGSLTSNWTNGTASGSYTAVDEVPHDSDTSYWEDNGSTDDRTVALDSAATGGVSGTIHSVIGTGIIRDTYIFGGLLCALKLRSGTTDSTNAAATTTETYAAYSRLLTADPATSAAWTSGGIDGLEVGAQRSGSSNGARVTMLMAEVACTPTAAATVKHLAITGVG